MLVGKNAVPTIQDPGPGRAADLHGFVAVKALDSVRISGKDIRLPSPSVPDHCSAAPTWCYGFVLLASDRHTAEHVSWWVVAPHGEYTLNTNVFRFDRSSVVVDGGISVPLSNRFAIHGCDANTRAALAKSTAGATFSLDGKTAKVTSAGCNGTE